MSDLAPFVASVLHDSVVEDLEREIAHLRRTVEANRCDVEITGPGGSPTYAAADCIGRSTFLAGLVKSCSPQDLLHAEFRFRGADKVKTFKLKDMIVDTETFSGQAKGPNEAELWCHQNTEKSPFVRLCFAIDFATQEQQRKFQSLFVDPSENIDDFPSFDWRSSGSLLPLCSVYFYDLILSSAAKEEIQESRRASTSTVDGT